MNDGGFVQHRRDDVVCDFRHVRSPVLNTIRDHDAVLTLIVPDRQACAEFDPSLLKTEGPPDLHGREVLRKENEAVGVLDLPRMLVVSRDFVHDSEIAVSPPYGLTATSKDCAGRSLRRYVGFRAHDDERRDAVDQSKACAIDNRDPIPLVTRRLKEPRISQ